MQDGAEQARSTYALLCCKVPDRCKSEPHQQFYAPLESRMISQWIKRFAVVAAGAGGITPLLAMAQHQ